MRKELANVLVANRSFILTYLLFLIAGIIALLFYSKAELFLIFNANRAVWADIFFKYWTHVGDGLFFAAAIVGALFYRFGTAIYLLLSLLLTGIISQVLKKLVFSESLRPVGWFGSESFVQTVDGHTLYSFNSFPSGHTATAFALMMGFSLLAHKKSWGVLLAIAAALVGYSRVYLGQHFFEDIYFGSFLGVFSALVLWLTMEKPLSGSWASKSLLNFRK